MKKFIAIHIVSWLIGVLLFLLIVSKNIYFSWRPIYPIIIVAIILTGVVICLGYFRRLKLLSKIYFSIYAFYLSLCIGSFFVNNLFFAIVSLPITSIATKHEKICEGQNFILLHETINSKLFQTKQNNFTLYKRYILFEKELANNVPEDAIFLKQLRSMQKLKKVVEDTQWLVVYGIDNNNKEATIKIKMPAFEGP